MSNRFPPPTERKHHRIVTFRSVELLSPSSSKIKTLSKIDAEATKYGRYTKYIRDAGSSLPQLLASEKLVNDFKLDEDLASKVQIIGVDASLFISPVNTLIVSIGLNLNCDPETLVKIVDNCHHNRFLPYNIVRDWLSNYINDFNLDNDVHQIVLVGANKKLVPGDELIQKLIYRANLPIRKSFLDIRYPSELNHRPYSIGALSQVVTVLQGQQEYVENTIIISAIHLLAGTARLRIVRNNTFELLSVFRESASHDQDYKSVRDYTAHVLNNIIKLELELSFGVEAVDDIFSSIPAVRIADYHEELQSVLRLKERSNAVSVMLSRLKTAAETQMTVVKTAERKHDELRRRAWSAAIGAISSIAIPFGVISGILDISTNGANLDFSIENYSDYEPIIYIFSGTYLLGFIVLVSFWIWAIIEKRKLRIDTSNLWGKSNNDKDM